MTHSLGEPQSNTTLYQQLVGSLHQVWKFMFATRSTHYDTVLFFDILRAPFSMLCTFLFSLLFYKPTLMLIKQEIPPIDGPLLDIASSFTPLWSLKKSKKQSIVANFSTEAEYCVFADTTSELLRCFPRPACRHLFQITSYKMLSWD